MEGEDETCPICGGRDFENQMGHYYCQECGTQSQKRRDEAEDEEAVGIMSHQIRVKKGEIKKLATDAEEEITQSLHESWQIIYLNFINELIKEGYDPSIKETGKLLWFLFLNKIYKIQLKSFNRIDTIDTPCYALTGTNISYKAIKMSYYAKRREHNLSYLQLHGADVRRKNRQKSFRKRQESESEQESDDDNEPEEIESGEGILNDVNKLQKRMKKILNFARDQSYVTKRTLLVLAYLALLYSGQYVLQSDFVNLVYSDAISWFSWYKLLPQGLARKLLSYYASRINDRKSLRVNELGFTIRHVKVNIGLYTLPLDVTVIYKVLLQKMLLPESLLPLLRRLSYVFYEEPLKNLSFEKRRPNVNIDLVIMINIIIIIKLIYRLDDNFENLQSLHCLGPHQPIDKSKCVYVWEDWVSMVTRQQYDNLQSTITPSKPDLVHLDDNSCYVKFLREKCFSLYSLEATSGERKVAEKNHVIPPIYTSYMRKRRARNIHNRQAQKQGERPLFSIISDKVKSVHGQITPRWIPIDFNLPSCGFSASCYHPVPSVSYVVVPLHTLGLPNSQQFLYNYAARLIGVTTPELMYTLNVTEQLLINEVQRDMSIINICLKSRKLDEDDS